MNRNKLDGAKELKKMVFFSNIVVAPMLEDMQVMIDPQCLPYSMQSRLAWTLLRDSEQTSYNSCHARSRRRP